MFRTFRAKYAQGAGKVRRFLLTQHYVNQQLAKRRGKCARCGACCKLLFKCPFLIERHNGTTFCRIHRYKSRNCKIFPINQQDISERNLSEPHIACGFHFEESH